MCKMPRTCDEFGEFLYRLRTAKGYSAKSLSLAVGKSPSYIGGWERYSRPVNKSVLQRVADELSASAWERQRLFQLADVRNSPDEAKALYGTDPGANLVHALLSLDNYEKPEGIDAPPARSTFTASLANAAGWVLALWAINSGRDDFDFESLIWPDDVYELGLVNRRKQAGDSKDRRIIDDRLRNDIDITARMGDAPLVQNSFAQAMAEAYRDWLFAHTDRALECVRCLYFWSIQRGVNEPVLTLRFTDAADDDRFRVDGISCDVVEQVNKRQVEYIISAARTPDSASQQPYMFVPDRVDYGPLAISRVPGALSPSEHTNPSFGRSTLTFNLQSVLDCIYNLSDAHSWSSPHGIGKHGYEFSFGHSEYSLNPGDDEQREELIDRLRRIERRIKKRLGEGVQESDADLLDRRALSFDADVRVRPLPRQSGAQTKDTEPGQAGKRAKDSTKKRRRSPRKAAGRRKK